MSADPITFLCPRDGTELAVRRWNGSQYGQCPRCQGIRIARAALERMVGAGLQPPIVPPGPGAEAVEVVEGTALCSCPGQPLMDRMERGDLSLDVCPRCGAVWFDPGEIRRYLHDRRTSKTPGGRGTKRRLGRSVFDAGEAIGGLGEVFELVFFIVRFLF